MYFLWLTMMAQNVLQLQNQIRLARLGITGVALSFTTAVRHQALLLDGSATLLDGYALRGLRLPVTPFWGC